MSVLSDPPVPTNLNIIVVGYLMERWLEVMHYDLGFTVDSNEPCTGVYGAVGQRFIIFVHPSCPTIALSNSKGTRRNIDLPKSAKKIERRSRLTGGKESVACFKSIGNVLVMDLHDGIKPECGQGSLDVQEGGQGRESKGDTDVLAKCLRLVHYLSRVIRSSTDLLGVFRVSGLKKGSRPSVRTAAGGNKLNATQLYFGVKYKPCRARSTSSPTSLNRSQFPRDSAKMRQGGSGKGPSLLIMCISSESATLKDEPNEVTLTTVTICQTLDAINRMTRFPSSFRKIRKWSLDTYGPSWGGARLTFGFFVGKT
ncbi:hypothetical protein DFH09DRAFT_1466953 [Mycena vulgaris]|nr:hypothetical protein DFH09DRAFT_1466953 [Mycena vulgaris]